MKRPPAVEDMLGVWDDQGPYPLRSTHEVAQLIAWVKTLEQRTVAAHMHIARARGELATALDVLAGEVTA